MAWSATLGRLRRTVRDTFPCAVVFKPAAGGSYPITAIYDEDYMAVTPAGDALPVTTTGPVLTVNLDDLPVVPHVRDRVDVGATTFEVSDVKPDGSGMTVLQLVEVT